MTAYDSPIETVRHELEAAELRCAQLEERICTLSDKLIECRKELIAEERWLFGLYPDSDDRSDLHERVTELRSLAAEIEELTK